MKDQLLQVDQILTKLKDHEIFVNKPEISFVLLGGSTITHTNGWWSDTDIFVFLDIIESAIDNLPETILSSFNMDLLIDLGIKLEDILKTDHVQLSILNTLPLMVQFEVLKNYEPLFIRDEELFFQFKEYTLKVAIDFSVWQQKWLDESLRAEN